jgi:pyruvate/2-oxoglutarate dehydrogenase complex dihydrolipoamide dehydrogenase (E3) component
MADKFDAVVIGAGPAGEVCAGELAAGGLMVAVIERERVAGECSFWACMPSKALLRSGEALAAARRVPGAEQAVTSELDVKYALAWRDKIVSNWDDSDYVTWLTDRGVALFRGSGRIAGEGVVEVEGRTLRTDHIVLATGSHTAAPPIEGLDQTAYWTNREATAVHQLPGRLLVMGGGPIGVELAQAYARFGVSVSLIEAADRVLPGEDQSVAAALQPVLEDDGVEVRVGARIVRVHGGELEQRVELADGTELRGDKLLVATGRRPNVDGLGLESSQVKLENGAIIVDDRLRAAAGIWAIGDVNGVNMTTHVGKYQARIAAADILGKDVRADYRSAPRVTYTDPQVFGVGMNEKQASEAGLKPVVGHAKVAATAASSLHRADWRDAHDEFLTLIADAEKQTLIGAYAVGPRAADWMGQASLAIQTRATIKDLEGTIQPFPAMSEIFTSAANDLSSRAS